MEEGLKENLEPAEKTKINQIPGWLNRVLLYHTETDLKAEEKESNHDPVASAVARWNLQTAQKLIRAGHWAPTPENLKTLQSLSRQYYPELEHSFKFS